MEPILIKEGLKFKDYDVNVYRTRYVSDPRNAIIITDQITRELLFVASCNLPEYPCGEHQTYIKNWSENEGILPWLIEQGIVSKPITSVPTGHVEAQLVNIIHLQEPVILMN